MISTIEVTTEIAGVVAIISSGTVLTAVLIYGRLRQRHQKRKIEQKELDKQQEHHRIEQIKLSKQQEIQKKEQKEQIKQTRKKQIQELLDKQEIRAFHVDQNKYPICPNCDRSGTYFNIERHNIREFGFPQHWWLVECVQKHCQYKWLMIGHSDDLIEAKKQRKKRQKKPIPHHPVYGYELNPTCVYCLSEGQIDKCRSDKLANHVTQHN